MKAVNFEQEVKKVHPNAWCEYVQMHDFYLIRVDKNRHLSPRLNAGDKTKEAAWESAYEYINIIV